MIDYNAFHGLTFKSLLVWISKYTFALIAVLFTSHKINLCDNDVCVCVWLRANAILYSSSWYYDITCHSSARDVTSDPVNHK